jgi:uncharacterized membrane protein YhaH (DUF805 family)
MDTVDTTDIILDVLISVALVASFVIPYFRIYQRTGRSGWWALLMFIPVVNIIAM